MSWVSPTGYVDSGAKWTDEAKLYDGSSSTRAESSSIASLSWGSYIELTHAAMVCNKVRFDALYVDGYTLTIDVDAYYGGAWHDVYQGSYNNHEWTEKSLDSVQTITAFRFRFYNQHEINGINQLFYEVEFYEVAPTTVTTQACSSVLETSALGNGNITATGDANATRRGFCYMAGTSGDPTTANSTVYDNGDFGTGAFSKSITGLTKGTGYRVRAYAINTAGTSYGATVQLTTDSEPTVTTQEATDITGTTATGNGNITSLGGDTPTKRGICWSTSQNPTIADSKDEDTGSFGTGAFTGSLTSLTPGETYYVRAYAYNTVGYGYGSQVSFIAIQAPTVTTQAVSAIALTTATGNGNITAIGSSNATKRGVCYNTTGSPTTADSKKEESGSFGTGAFTASLTNLSSGTKYFAKAYAINPGGTSYGDEVNFTTGVVVTTQAPTDVLAETVTANGNITSLGGGNATVKGFQYGLTQTATWSASDSGSYTTGAYTKGLTSLTANTTYWIRAYATNPLGTFYGDWTEFQTAAQGTIPTGTKLDICSDYTGYTYQVQESETDDGNAYTAYFVMSTDLTDKQGLAFNKRVLDMYLYFNKEDSGTADIYVKRDSETSWQSLGSVDLTGSEDILVQHLATNFRGKHFLFKISATNHFEFLGCLFEYVKLGMR